MPALLMAGLGSLSVDRNTVSDSYGGFWLVSQTRRPPDFFDPNAVGDPAKFLTFAQQATTPLLDRILVIAPAIGQALPPPPPERQRRLVAAGSAAARFRDCQVDAVITGSNSGAGLLVVDLAEATGSAVIHGSRIRTRFPAGDTALAYRTRSRPA